MQNKLRISSGGLYPRLQAHTKSNLESGYGLQRRPRIAIEDVRDSRGGDARLLRDLLDASVAVPLSPQIDDYGLDHRVLGYRHIETGRPSRVTARRRGVLGMVPILP